MRVDVAKIACKYHLEREEAHDVIADTLLDLMRTKGIGWYDDVRVGLIRTAVRRDLIDLKRKANAHFRKRVRFVSSESIPEGHVHATQRHNGKPMPQLKAHDDDLVDDLLSVLDEREFTVVSRCVIGCIPQTRIANELNVSRQYVAKIRDQAIDRMRSRFTSIERD